MLTTYFSRVAPGTAAFVLLLIALPRASVALRMAAYIFAFILMRDAMTPVGLWSLSRDGLVSFSSDPFTLVVLGTLSGALVLGSLRVEPGLARLIVWTRGNVALGVIAGFASAFLIAAPVLLRVSSLPSHMHPARVGGTAMMALLYLAMVGNLLEEVLFRGWLQGLLESETSRLRAAAGSAIAFAAGHAFLGITVTDLGLPILAFTLYEGIVTAALRLRWGVVPAAIAHGGGIFLIASHLL